MIVIELRGEVLAKAAPRFAVHGKIARAYVAEPQLRYAEALRYAASKAMDHVPPLQGPLHMDLMVNLLPLKSFSKRKYNRALAGLEYPATRPDLSNYIKMVEDAMNKVVFEDDNQIVSMCARKRYWTEPGVRIEISIA